MRSLNSSFSNTSTSVSYILRQSENNCPICGLIRPYPDEAYCICLNSKWTKRWFYNFINPYLIYVNVTHFTFLKSEIIGTKRSELYRPRIPPPTPEAGEWIEK